MSIGPNTINDDEIDKLKDGWSRNGRAKFVDRDRDRIDAV